MANTLARVDDAVTVPAPGPRWPNTASMLVLALAALKLIGTMLVSGRYGFHRDEFYYIACARHLAFGYVDFPPVTPLLARLDLLIFGVSLPGLRLLSILAGSIVVVLAARMAANLGGGPLAQVLAAAAVVVSPMFLGANLLFQTVSFDQLTWAIVLYLAIRLLRTGDSRLWLALGLAVGIGLETKYTIAALVAGLICGVLLTPIRDQLRTPWPWLGAAIALILFAPNLVWQIQNGWPSLTYIHTHSADTGSRISFLAETLLLLGPTGLPLAVLGAIEFFKRRDLRLLAWTCLIAVLILFLSNGKSYYAGPLYPLLFAAGSVRLEELWQRRRRIVPAIAAVLLLLTVPLVPLSLPVLPARAAIDAGMVSARKDYADMFGWHELTASVARVYRSLPPGKRNRVTIWANNYGEAGAIDLYGPRYGLPHAISTHLTYYYWKPARTDDRTVIAVGIGRRYLTPLFVRVLRVGTIRNAYGVDNEENGRPLYLCSRPRKSLDQAWPSLQSWD